MLRIYKLHETIQLFIHLFFFFRFFLYEEKIYNKKKLIKRIQKSTSVICQCENVKNIFIFLLSFFKKILVREKMSYMVSLQKDFDENLYFSGKVFIISIFFSALMENLVNDRCMIKRNIYIYFLTFMIFNKISKIQRFKEMFFTKI